MVTFCQNVPLQDRNTITRKTGVVARILKGSPIKMIIVHSSIQPPKSRKRLPLFSESAIRYDMACIISQPESRMADKCRIFSRVII